jgi:outer membrane protein assembly factor BamD
MIETFFSKVSKYPLDLISKSVALIVLCCIFTDGFSLGKSSVRKLKTDSQIKNCPVSEENLYKQGIELIKSGKYKKSAKHFFQMYTDKPASKFAASSILLEAYALYKDNDYLDALCTLKDLETFHPNGYNTEYVHYLKILCYEQQMSSIKGCSAAQQNAIELAHQMAQLFPKSPYTEDVLKNHVPIIENYLSEKEMFVGRFHLNNLNPIGAILSFKHVAANNKDGYFVQEALFRMTESYLMMGLKEEALECEKMLSDKFAQSFWTKAAKKQILQYTR